MSDFRRVEKSHNKNGGYCRCFARGPPPARTGRPDGVYLWIHRPWEGERESDVDLLVIGDAKFSEIVEVLSPVQQALSREINPMVLSVEELKKRIQDADHFIESVLKTTLIPVIGELDELNGMAEKRIDR